MDLAEVDLALEALGTPRSSPAYEAGLDLEEVDAALEALSEGVGEVHVQGLGVAPVERPASEAPASEAPASEPPAPQAEAALEAEGPITQEVGTDELAAMEESAAQSSPPPPAAKLSASTLEDMFQGMDLDDEDDSLMVAPPPKLGLNEDSLFGDLDGASVAPLVLDDEPAAEEPAAADGFEEFGEFQEEEHTALFSAADVQAIRRSSAPPPQTAKPSVPPPVPGGEKAVQAALDDMVIGDASEDEEFELLIDDLVEEVEEDEDEGEGEDATFVGTMEDFEGGFEDFDDMTQLESPLAAEAAAPVEGAPEGQGAAEAAEAADGEAAEGEEGEDGDGSGRKSFFKKLFG